MSVVNIEFWNNAGFTKLNMMEKNIRGSAISGSSTQESVPSNAI